jgi:hypothetical protein
LRGWVGECYIVQPMATFCGRSLTHASCSRGHRRDDEPGETRLLTLRPGVVRVGARAGIRHVLCVHRILCRRPLAPGSARAAVTRPHHARSPACLNTTPAALVVAREMPVTAAQSFLGFVLKQPRGQHLHRFSRVQSLPSCHQLSPVVPSRNSYMYRVWETSSSDFPPRIRRYQLRFAHALPTASLQKTTLQNTVYTPRSTPERRELLLRLRRERGHHRRR